MSPYASLGELRQDAVQSFVRTALLIDNEPMAEARKPLEQPSPKIAVSAAYGAAPAAKPPEGPEETEAVAATEQARPAVAADTSANVEAAAVAQVAAAKGRNGGHQLAVRPVTNAFASRKITCGFYFPANDDADVVNTALNAARHVDATIVDWQLKPGDAEPAKDLISKLIADDRAAGGRLRLIVVYTGERGLDGECAKLHEHLQAVGLTDFVFTDDSRALRAPNSLITFANKPARDGGALEFEGPAARPVAWEDLPAFVLKSYASLTEGLLQSFALKSIGAVRDDTHHLLSVFPPELDGAYLAQRAGIGTPTDAQEMMTALLAAEFATSITDRRVEADVLGPASAALSVTARAAPEKIGVKTYKAEPVYKDVVVLPNNGGAKHIVADKASLESLVRTGIDSKVIDFKPEERKKLDLQFFTDDADGKAHLSRFARLATYTREVDSGRRMRESLNLTGGIIVRTKIPAAGERPATEQYLLCVQPGCDAVRLSGEVAFPFCPMKPSKEAFDLIIDAGGAVKTFKVVRKPRELRLVTFASDPTSQTVVSSFQEDVVGFTAVDGVFWEFVAELRALEAQHFTTLLVGKFNRVALNSSEWLRLHRGDGDD